MTLQKCAHCGEDIELGDEPRYVGTPFGQQSMHVECMVRAVSGSVGHMMGCCSCTGQLDTSEDGLTRREAAIRAFAFYKLKHGVTG